MSSKSSIECPYRRGAEEDLGHGRRLCNDRSRDSGGVSTSQGLLAGARGRGPGARPGTDPSSEPLEETSPALTSILASGFSKGATINGCGWKPPSLWYLVTIALKSYNRGQDSQRSELEGEARRTLGQASHLRDRRVKPERARASPGSHDHSISPGDGLRGKWGQLRTEALPPGDRAL